MGSYPGLLGQSLAAVAAHKPGELPKLIATQYRKQGDESPCRRFVFQFSQAYELANGKSKGVAARFTADVTALDLRGETLAAGSADMTLKTVDTATSKCTSYEGHEAPILGVALDPEFLGTCNVL